MQPNEPIESLSHELYLAEGRKREKKEKRRGKEETKNHAKDVQWNVSNQLNLSPTNYISQGGGGEEEKKSALNKNKNKKGGEEREGWGKRGWDRILREWE